MKKTGLTILKSYTFIGLLVLAIPSFSFQNVQTIKVNPREAGALDLEVLADSIAVLKLENTEESFFGHAAKVVMTESRVLIYTGGRIGGVFVFDRNGKFVFKVLGGGQGPQELDRITNIAADGDDLLVYGDLAHKVLRYSPDGKFLNAHKVGFYANNFTKVGSQWFFNLQGSSRGEFGGQKFMSTSFEFKDTKPMFRARETSLIDAFSYQIFLPRSNDALFTLPLIDTVFSVGKNGVLPLYYVDFGKFKMDEELVGRSYGRDIFDKMSKVNYAQLKMGLTYSNDLLGFVYVKRNRGAKKGNAVRYLYYDVKNERVIWHYHSLNISRFGASISLSPSQYREQNFVTETFMSLFEHNEGELNNADREGTSEGYGLLSLDDAMAAMRQEDNPYIIIYSIRKN